MFYLSLYAVYYSGQQPVLPDHAKMSQKDTTATNDVKIYKDKKRKSKGKRYQVIVINNENSKFGCVLPVI